MPTYLWTCKTKSGKDITERVTAATADEARDILLAQGLTDLRLEIDGTIQDFIKGQIEAVSDPAYRPSLAPREELDYHQGKGPGFWKEWWKCEREMWKSEGETVNLNNVIPVILVVLGLGWSIYRHLLWGIIFFGGLLTAMVLLFPVLRFWFGKPSRLFAKMHQARTWWRWNEVLECLEEFKTVQRSRKMGIGKPAMAQYRALALAGLGKLDEAVKVFTETAEKSNMPNGVYYSLLSTIYGVACEYEKALDCRRRAVEEATDKGIFYIDVASYLVSRFNRPAEARQFLAMAEWCVLPEQVKAHLPYVRALIEFREGDFSSARTHTLEALGKIENQAKGRYHVFEAMILLCQGHLAVINAKLGNKAEARDYFEKSVHYLETTRMDELLDQYREATGLGHRNS